MVWLCKTIHGAWLFFVFVDGHLNQVWLAWLVRSFADVVLWIKLFEGVAYRLIIHLSMLSPIPSAGMGGALPRDLMKNVIPRVGLVNWVNFSRYSTNYYHKVKSLSSSLQHVKISGTWSRISAPQWLVTAKHWSLSLRAWQNTWSLLIYSCCRTKCSTWILQFTLWWLYWRVIAKESTSANPSILCLQIFKKCQVLCYCSFS